MNPAATDPDAGDESLVYEFELEAPLEKVWHALTAPELLARWLLPLTSEPPAQIELDSCAPPHYIAYRWQGTDEPQSLVIFELRTGADGGTQLRLTHQRAAVMYGPVAYLEAA
jgi:uncharacterized protein YndB with AHSA1/START domain